MAGEATDSFFEDSPNSVVYGAGAVYDLSDEARRIAGRIGSIKADYPRPDATEDHLLAEYERDVNLLRNNQRTLLAVAEILEAMSDEWRTRWPS